MVADLLDRLYRALDAGDGDAMAACYTPDATFEDPVFGQLTGEEVGDMWRMLCGGDADLRVEYEVLAETPTAGRATWTARYRFSAGRPVVNRVTSTFRLHDGLIAVQQDEFDLWRWAAQALGLPGRLLGWTPMMRTQVRRRARVGLARFRDRRG